MNIVFHLPNKIKDCFYSENDKMARELYYGSDYLAQHHSIDWDEERLDSAAGRWPAILKRNGMGLLSFSTMRKIAWADLIIVKDHFCLLLSLYARLRGTPVIYLDSMFEMPRYRISRWVFAICIRLSARTISYSRTQNALWADKLGLKSDHFMYLPFCIDFDFYDDLMPARKPGRSFLAVGRDTGRDYRFLVNTFSKLENELDIVTLPYLLPDSTLPENVRAHSSIPYEALASLYAGAKAHIIPLKEPYSYPSGIRAVLESIAYKVPVVASMTPVLKEYFPNQLFYYKAGNEAELQQMLVNWDQYGKKTDTDQTYDYARNNFDYRLFCTMLLDFVNNMRTDAEADKIGPASRQK